MLLEPRLYNAVFSPDECDSLRGLPPVESNHDDGGGHGDEGHISPKQHRVQWLADRIGAAINCDMPGCDVDPSVKLYKLECGDAVAPHRDLDFEHDGRVARWSALVYLSSGHSGGETEFIEEGMHYQANAGDVLVFPHSLLHAGTPVTAGTRYVLKTDVFESAS